MALNISLILLGCFMTNIVAIVISITNPPTICDNVYNEIQYIRNNALRVILSNELNRTKHKYRIVKRMIDRNVMHKFNKVLSRYYDVNYTYNSLTDAEKSLLEVLVSLTY
jgi:hypothetical protein